MPDTINPSASKGTSTQVRTLYSEGVSFITIKLYNTNISFNMTPFVGKDANGKNQYDQTKRTYTNFVDYGIAASLCKLATDIANGTINTVRAEFDCFDGAKIILESRPEGNQSSYWLTLERNGNGVPFKFDSKVAMINNTQKTIESGLMVFAETLRGYLDGINTDRHLDKLTEEFAKTQEAKQADGTATPAAGGYQNKYSGGGYQKKPYNPNYNNYKKNNYNNGGGYQKPQYNNNNNQGAQSTPPWEAQPAQSIGMSSFNVQE